MTDIRYVVGDATDPVGDGPKLIAHVVNDIGAWGAGFAKALSVRSPKPKKVYREWHAEPSRILPFELGRTQITRIADDTLVMNMLAQSGLRSRSNPRPLRYDALALCLRDLAGMAGIKRSSVHMPRIGCGLAGGTWDVVEPLIADALCGRGVEVTVYDLPGGGA